MTDPGLTIEIYSDVVCPWCYIGKRRLERALDQHESAAQARIIWRPFQLNPTMPKAGMDRRVYLEAKFGGPAAMKSIQDRVAAVGTSVGIDFAFDRIARTPNTFDAHRLIWLAQREGRQDEAVEELFHGYFVEGLELATHEGLLLIAERAGLSREKTLAFLQSNEGIVEVQGEEARGHRLGIRGVPYFVFNGSTTISGAQPVETFVSTIGQLSGQTRA
ncbi:MAG TPA: DsbA family oxidoreductase [Nitrospiraceae bacterium]|nr:DsbA family oxidoreductase [Nitrospiraceae bacterium]